jgi:uncharacterized repeat protein (TIGR01451 family)
MLFRVTVNNSIPAGVNVIRNAVWKFGTTPDGCSNTAATDACDPGNQGPAIENPLGTALVGVKSSNPASGTVVAAGRNITYTVTLSNSNATALTSQKITDVIPAGTTYVPGSLACSPSGTAVQPTAANGQKAMCSNITVPAAANGVNGVATMVFTVTVNNTATTQVTNVARTGDDPNPSDPTNTTDPSGTTNQVVHPLVQAVKTSDPVTGTRVTPGQEITYTIRVTNPSTTTALTNQRITDLVPENTTYVANSLTCTAPAQGSTTGTPASKVVCSGYTIPAGGSVTMVFKVRVNNSIPAGVNVIRNAVWKFGTTPDGCANTAATDACDPGNQGPAIENPLGAETPQLLLRKTVNKTTVEFGDAVTYTITVENIGQTDVREPRVVDTLPLGFTYAANSVVDASGNRTINEPAGAPGRVLTFTLPTTLTTSGAGRSYTFSYRVRVGVGARPDTDAENIAVARCEAGSDTDCSNVGRAKVRVEGGVFTTAGGVTGKVFVDCNGNHVQELEELGIPGVRLYMQDGRYFITDAEGKYSFMGLQPGTHVIKLDLTTMPRRSRIMTTSSRNLGDGNSIFVDLQNGQLARADFVEGSCNNDVIEQVKGRRAEGGATSLQTEKPGLGPLKFESKPAPQGNPIQQGTDSANQPVPPARLPILLPPARPTN